MELAKLVLEYLKVLILPITVFIVFFSLRKEIKTLLNGKLSAQYKDLIITLERKEAVIESMQENFREASQAVEKEIRALQREEKWSGFDYKANRIMSALSSINLNSDQHIMLHFIKKRGGTSSVSELVHEFIKPGPHMEVNEFQTEKQRLDLALDGLKEKGIISASDKGFLRLHPWVNQAMEKEPTLCANISETLPPQ